MIKPALLVEPALPTHEQSFKLDAIQIFKGATWFGLATGAGMILEYVIQTVLAARLGPSDFGTFSIGLQIFTVSLTLAMLALPSALTYSIPSYENQEAAEQTSMVLTASFWLSLISSLLVGGILFFIARPISEQLFQEPGLTPVLRLMGLAIPSSAMLALLAGGLRGLKLGRQASLLTSSYDRALRLVFIVVFLLLGLGLKAPALAYLPASILALVWGLRYLRRSPARLRPYKPTVKVYRDLLRYSGPVLLSQLLLATRAAIQPLMLAYFLDTTATGVYAVAQVLAGSFSMVLVAINFLYLPVISGIFAAGELDRMRRIYRLVTTWGVICIFPVCLLVVFLPTNFLNLFGARYGEGARALQILVAGSLINVGTGPVGTTLLATGQTRSNLLITFIGTVISISLGLLLIPAVGLIGAATAQVLSGLIVNGLNLLLVYKMYRHHPFSRHFAYVFMVGLVCSVPLYPVIQLAIGFSSWAIIGLIPFYIGFTLLVLFKFQLLDADSQAIASDIQVSLRARLILIQSRLLSPLQ